METNTKQNTPDEMPLSPEEIKAIGEIQIGPAKHEVFLNNHYKKLIAGGVVVIIAATAGIAYYAYTEQQTEEAGALVVQAVGSTVADATMQPANYEPQALDSVITNYEGTASEYITVLEGIQEYLGDDVRVRYSDGCHLFKNKVSGLGQENDRIAEVRAVCDASDVVIAVMGLDSGLEGEEGDQGNEFASGDKPNLELPGLQNTVLQEIYASGKPVVLVLLSGSALAFPWAEEHIPAIVQAWYPGAQGGRAVAQMLFGEYAPEGKLPVTFYRTSEELPAFTDYNMKGRTYRYMEN
jgi:hypothetical protein